MDNVLKLISDLYGQIVALQAENKTLREELETKEQ